MRSRSANPSRCAALLLLLSAGLAGCGKSEGPAIAQPPAESTRVQTSGKEEISVEALPSDVVAAAKSVRPQLEITAAEHELRNGADYYDVAGRLNGAEIELDITRIADGWMVVEVQRDLNSADVPAEVTAALVKEHPEFAASRIIESDQGDGLVIYEFFGAAADGKDAKIEVRFQNGKADVLNSEWPH